MSHKIKSTLYFTSLVLAIITYYHIENVNTASSTELAENVENVSTIETLP